MIDEKIPEANAILEASAELPVGDRMLIAEIGILAAELSPKGYNTLALALFLTIGQNNKLRQDRDGY